MQLKHSRLVLAGLALLGGASIFEQSACAEVLASTFNSGTAFIRQYNDAGVQITSPITSTIAAWSMAKDSSGILYVATSGRIRRYNGITGQAMTDAYAETGMNFFGMVVTPGGDLLASDNTQIYRINLTTNAVTTGIGAGTLSSASKLIMSTDGNVLVSDPGASRIRKLNLANNSLSDFSLAPELVAPTGMDYGPDGNLYVINSGGAVNRFNPTTGAFISAFTSTGQANPRDIAFSGNLMWSIQGQGGDTLSAFNATTGAFVVSPFAGLSGMDLLVAVPEPFSFALLAPFGMMLLARRRR